jgi:glycerol-3-phosphate dehydrogenase
LPANICHHLARAYGTRIHILLQDMASLEDMGQCFGNILTEAEIRYLINHEFAHNGEDIMWRRSKLGLHMTQEQRAAASAATQAILAAK